MHQGRYTARIRAFAKINLFLDITGRRPDGYHTLTGVMQTVDLYDTVRLTADDLYHSDDPADVTGKDPDIRLACSDPALPTDRRNLAYRAAEIFSETTGFRFRHLLVELDKQIPQAGGLAGGSADAAAVLRGLNALCHDPLSLPELSDMALQLGADVPFCLVGGTRRTDGLGERMTPCAPLPMCDIVLAAPSSVGEGVSTPEAYRRLDEAYGFFAPDAYTPHKDRLTAFLVALQSGDTGGIGRQAFNLFESVILPGCPVASRAGQILAESGGFCTQMSGSGPSVFSLFACGEGKRAETALVALQKAHIPAFLCRPVSSLPAVETA